MEYLELAEQAKKEKAHVAVVMYCRNVAEQAAESQTVDAIVESTVEYAACLKKPTDQQAVYDWAKRLASKTELVEKIDNAMKELGGKQHDTTPTA